MHFARGLVHRPLLATTIGMLMVAILSVGATAPAPARDDTRGSAGIGDPYFPLDGNGGIDVQHYAIDDTYRFATADTAPRLSGTTTLTVRATGDLTRFNLDFLLPVTSVRVDGAVAAVDQSRHHEVRITPDHQLDRGEQFTVEVTYAGNPAARRHRYAGERNWLADRREVVAMNEPHMAPWWFPANDHPRDKATFDIAITTDAAKQVISNGEQVGREVAGDLATTRWRTTDPMTTYLAFFAAGPFDITRGTSAAGTPYVNAMSRRLTGAAARYYRKVLARSGAVTDWLEKELGDYPFTSTGGLVTALHAGFALENQTRPTYSGGIDPSTQVHELAHQWFGDSVAVDRWRDIWLNEGFASYLEVRYREAHGGRSTDRWLRAEYRHWRPTEWYWELDLTDPGARHIFDAQVYNRGALTLAALRHRIGTSDFRTLLRRWVADHHDGNARVPQFIRLAESVSGEQLDGFFRAWLRSGRAPKATRANGLEG